MGTRGITTRVISGIDIALLDIKGKVANRPVYKLLGGFTDRVPVYIAGGYYEEGKGLEELAAETEESVSMGARAIKMKIGGATINEDVERVRIVRQAAGPDVKVMVDANCAYRYYEAIEIAKKMEKYDIFWFEEPVNPDDYQGYKLISQATTIPIATGERFTTIFEYQQLLEARATSYVRPDLCLCGGLSGCKKVAAMAEAHHVKVIPHNPLSPVSTAACVQLDACIPNFALQEYTGESEPPKSDLLVEPLELIDGYLTVPDGPGLGI